MFKRQLTPHASKSYFLLGPRQTGKSTWVHSQITPADLVIDLLPSRTHLDYLKTPGRFHQEVLAHARKHRRFTCVIDEIQKVPALLDDVHAFLESMPVRFILTGSSARKLKRGASNLLAARAYTYALFPLTFQELGHHFDLERALRYGTLPALWDGNKEDPKEFLKAYADTYLREEIQDEGVVRALGPFSQFLDVAAACDTEVVNYSAVARECGVSVKTVQQYYQILEDTFMAFRLPPWSKSQRHRLSGHPRYYLFDPGITNALQHRLSDPLDARTRGRRFEQWVVLQIRSALSYARSELEMSFWRTHPGAEVDLILSRSGKPVAAIEIKSSDKWTPADTRDLASFAAEYPKTPLFLLAPIPRERQLGNGVTAMPWMRFIENILLNL